jgi:hypothetical protein
MEFQSLFHQYWHQLRDPHVRALAWLLTSPDMLAARAQEWGGQIGSVPIPEPEALIAWLTQLDEQSAPLHQALELHKHKRLGRYAEKLLAYYLQQRGLLYAQGVQVHQHGANTLGEFDFLVRNRKGLLHWELATKFYLYGPPAEPSGKVDLYDFVGPDLVDTLGGKMQKMIEQQLTLARHPMAQSLLPEPVYKAQAIVKGWLFFRNMAQSEQVGSLISPDHCRGFWWHKSEVSKVAIGHAMILPRLQWLAPAQAREEETVSKPVLLDTLERHFNSDSEPVMVAIMRRSGDLMQEMGRGIVVPDNWETKLEERRGMLRDPLL